jgi:HemY protein
MAVTERGKGGDDETIRNLLNLAITAKRGPQWICETCNTANTDWEPICANCSAMDSLEWKVPPQEATNFTVSDDLLPFLAGEIKMDVPGNKAEPEKPTKKQNNKIK